MIEGILEQNLLILIFTALTLAGLNVFGLMFVPAIAKHPREEAPPPSIPILTAVFGISIVLIAVLPSLIMAARWETWALAGIGALSLLATILIPFSGARLRPDANTESGEPDLSQYEQVFGHGVFLSRTHANLHVIQCVLLLLLLVPVIGNFF